MPIKVALWTESYWPTIGGVQVFGKSLISGLKPRGFEFVVITNELVPGLPSEDSFEGTPIFRLPFYHAIKERRPELVMQTKHRLDELLDAFDPDLIHINLTGPSVFFWSTSRLFGNVPYVVTIHVLLEGSQTAGSLQHSLLENASAVVLPSRTVEDNLVAHYPGLKFRFEVIANAVGTPDFAPSPPPLDPPRLLSISRLVSEKGVDLTLQAFAKVLEAIPDVKMVVAGEGPDRPLLEAIASDLGIAEGVDFCGGVHPGEVPSLINRASLVVASPRGVESFGLVALEAALMERPVVAFATGGFTETVINGETGFLVKPTPSALSKGITDLLQKPELIVQMGKRARVRALTEFGWEHFLDNYESLFRKNLATGE